LDKEDYMGAARDLVITVYGHDKTIDKIAVSAFEEPVSHYGGYRASGATTYCNTLNSLELNGNSWVYAKIVSENTPYTLDLLFPLNFDIFLKLDDKAIQKVLREVDSQDIAKALKGEKEAVQERIFSNMSERAVKMLKEDIEYIPGIDVEESQEKIINVIRRLGETGEIVISYSKGEAKE
jgi:flagellar motor switch protein FliG